MLDRVPDPARKGNILGVEHLLQLTGFNAILFIFSQVAKPLVLYCYLANTKDGLTWDSDSTFCQITLIYIVLGFSITFML